MTKLNKQDKALFKYLEVGKLYKLRPRKNHTWAWRTIFGRSPITGETLLSERAVTFHPGKYVLILAVEFDVTKFMSEDDGTDVNKLVEFCQVDLLYGEKVYEAVWITKSDVLEMFERVE